MNSELSRLYKIRFENSELPAKNAVWKVLCSNYFSKFIKDSDVVVDLACGHGEFSNHIRAKERIAIDLNPDARGYLDPQVRFFARQANRFSSSIKSKVDVIFTSNFLEHLPDKVALDVLIVEVARTLKGGGRFMILGPNLRYLPGEYWDFYDHHLGLTHLSLCEALRLHGLEIELCVDRFLPYTTKGALPSHPWLVKAYLKVPWAWRFFGKQFFIIARKPI